MKKIALLLLFVMVCTAPAYAQDQQTGPTLIASDLFDKARDLIVAEKYDQAVLDLSLFILVNPTYTVGYYVRAEGYIGLSNFDSALQDVDQAIATAPPGMAAEYGSALYALRGEIDIHQQNSADALKDYSQSITIKPTLAALANRGLIYMDQTDFQSALSDFNGAITLDSSNPALMIYRGAANEGLHDQTAAATDYLSFLTTIQPNPTVLSPIATDQAATLQIDQGVVNVLPFTAKAKQYVSAVAVVQTGTVDPLLVMVDSQGKPLTGNDNGNENNNSLILNYQVAADGNYALVVGHSLRGFTGTIIVQLKITDVPLQ